MPPAQRPPDSSFSNPAEKSTGPYAVLSAAFKASIPVLLGYVTLGIAFGFTLVAAGLPWWLSPVMAIFIYAGAAQFMAIGLMTSGAGILEIALLTLLLNARHAVYGLSMLEKYRHARLLKPYLIFGLTDETYGILTTVAPPARANTAHFHAILTALHQLYWVAGCSIGAIAGSALGLDTTGMEFALTALFIVLLVEQIRVVTQREPYLAALGACIAALLLAGSRDFLLVALLLSIGALMVLKPRLEQASTARQGSPSEGVGGSNP
ncbi:MAG: AzlC family ABC transporter permease [Rectinemataceae bacterium]|nr:AzlC family ABC transporter permease [Spirochaetaceae bacterium]